MPLDGLQNKSSIHGFRYTLGPCFKRPLYPEATALVNLLFLYVSFMYLCRCQSHFRIIKLRYWGEWPTFTHCHI